MLIQEKIDQAVDLLDELDIDCWLTFVRESSMAPDPVLPFLIDSDVTWHSAFIIARSGETHAIVGQLDRKSVEDLGVYQDLVSYVEGGKQHVQEVIQKINPATVAINYSVGSEVCDGLTHGMYLTLKEYLSEIGFADRLVSSEKLVSKLRARKTETELNRIRAAIGQTLEIFCSVAGFLKTGLTEREIADFMLAEVEKRGLELAWDPAHCPAVFTGPDTAGAHYKPTERMVEPGHVLNMDFGVKIEDYCSDMQRTFFILEEGETEAPPEVRKGFETIVTSIELARRAIQAGRRGLEVDKVARQHIVGQGYEEFPHGLGHQVGRFAHDGTALLGPAWEKYATKPFEPLEEGMVFTIEPRLFVPGRGTVTVEEMVVIKPDGAEFLAPPQTDLVLIG
jgi:Xaa-Pro aminopeptidase